jgi:hypothetical protein
MNKKTKLSKNQKLLTDYYKNKEKDHMKVYYGYNDKTGHWHCLDCGIDMGDNSRQLCGKYYCLYES